MLKALASHEAVTDELAASRVVVKAHRSKVGIDAILAIAFAIASYHVRVSGLPHRGLFHDDAWVATGAIHGHPWQIFTVGSGHPGFTTLLMLISRMTGYSSALAYPAFGAGVLGAPFLFLALRRFGYARSIAAFCAAALVVADVHIMYSTRVKPYVIDVLIVAGIALLLPRLARRTWGWMTGLAWVGFAVAVGSVSGFALIATAIAASLLLLHARSDRVVRFTAVAAQAAAQLVIYVWMQRSSNLAYLERAQEKLYDAHLTFSWNPIEFGGEVLKHFRRVVDVYPGGPSWLRTVTVLVVVAGLIIAATNRRRAAVALRGQFLALILLFAVIAGTLDRLPFGPTTLPRFTSIFSRGERSTLWLIPVMAFGLAAAMQHVRGATQRSRRARVGFDVVVFVLTLLVVGSAINEKPPPYPFSGSDEEATRLLESQLGDHDVVLLPSSSTMPYAVETNSRVTLQARPKGDVGFVPEFDDPRIVAVGSRSATPATPAVIRHLVRDADHVFVYFAARGYGPDQKVITSTLEAAGFELADAMQVNSTSIDVWQPTANAEA